MSTCEETGAELWTLALVCNNLWSNSMQVFLSHCIVWLEAVFSQELRPYWTKHWREHVCLLVLRGFALLVDIPFTLKINENPFFVSRHCNKDNVTVSWGLPHSVQKTAGILDSKIPAADSSQNGNWWVDNGEWNRQCKGYFIRRMMLLSRAQTNLWKGLLRLISFIPSVAPHQR